MSVNSLFNLKNTIFESNQCLQIFTTTKHAHHLLEFWVSVVETEFRTHRYLPQYFQFAMFMNFFKTVEYTSK